jgi:hypothetical protein
MLEAQGHVLAIILSSRGRGGGVVLTHTGATRQNPPFQFPSPSLPLLYFPRPPALPYLPLLLPVSVSHLSLSECDGNGFLTPCNGP